MDAQNNSTYAQNIVAFFDSIPSAEKARKRLLEAGISPSSIRLSADGADGTSSSERSDEHQGFFEWLFGTDVPENERAWYGSNLQDGRAALSVRVNSPAEITKVEAIFQAEGALEVERDDDAMIGQTSHASMGATKSTGRSSSADEEVIPIVKEELTIGKQATETRRRVRTHVIERPVEKQVHLQDETVIVERRPVSGSTPIATGNLQDREFEIIERHEEPVVEKHARAVEEVVVKKDVKSRTETVGGKVRETTVEVEGKPVPPKK